MNLVLIHGRGQSGKQREDLQKEWIGALREGAQAAGMAWPHDLQVTMPFYGDELEQQVKRVDAPVAGSIKLRGTNIDARDPTFREDMLREFAAGMGLTEQDILEEMNLVAHTRGGPLNWEWVQAILRRMDKVDALSSTFLDAFTRDVYAYLTFQSVRAPVDQIVGASLTNQPTTIIAHSLGTIVAYHVLYQREKRGHAIGATRLVTVGSPLGVKSIKRRIDAPLRRAAFVQHWWNALDDRDVVALYPLTPKHFDVLPGIENKTDVRNGTSNHHGIVGYLSDPDVARACLTL